MLEEWPNEYVTSSHRILSEFREFDRISTAAVNAYIQPRIDRYFSRLADRLREHGYANDLLIMRSNGGVMRERLASKLSVQTVLSGPAAGVTAAARICADAGYANAITADVGGTSFDVGLIVDGSPETSSNHELAYNVPVRLPMIDIHTIGAGGGSIAHLDGTGLLRVGPESAGAQPGPVAFGRGGTRPTLTDAYLVTRPPGPGPDPQRGRHRRRRRRARRDRRGRGQRPRPLHRRGRRRRSSASPTTGWPAPSAPSRWAAATTRATSCTSRSAAAGR